MRDVEQILMNNRQVMSAVEDIYEAGFQAGLDTNCKGACLSNLDLTMSTDELNEYAEQRKERGFDDTEFFNFRQTFAKFLTPRLKRVLELKNEGADVGVDNKALTDMIEGFEYMQHDLCDLCGDYETIKRHKVLDAEDNALKLFTENISNIYAFTK